METFYYLIGESASDITWWQMCIRALIVFPYALALYRLLPQRAFMQTAAIDLIVMVLMGSSLSRALTGSSPLLPTLAATACFAALYVLMAILARKSERLSRLFKGRAARVIHKGELDRAAMRKAQLGDRDLMDELRQCSIHDIDEVAEAWVERSGTISVRRKD